MVIRDREEAGRLLAAKLEPYRDDSRALILALPRGGVAVGYELSLALRLPLDVFVTKKLGLPDNPEYAIGAVSETGALYLNVEAVEDFHLSHAELEPLIGAAKEEIFRRQQRYRDGLPLPSVADRTVILVDDDSSDGTADVARRAAAAVAGARLQVVTSRGPPPGWTGKLWAVKQGIDAAMALPRPPDFLLLTDADVVHAADSTSRRGRPMPHSSR